jgi:hypothetical protein
MTRSYIELARAKSAFDSFAAEKSYRALPSDHPAWSELFGYLHGRQEENAKLQALVIKQAELVDLLECALVNMKNAQQFGGSLTREMADESCAHALAKFEAHRKELEGK